MTQPLLAGRKLPRNDWEGDDFTPGAGGHYVTCQDTAAGRMLAYATNDLYDLDGRTIRAAIQPADAGGVNFGQVAVAIIRLTDPHRTFRHGNLTLATFRDRLSHRLGLVVDGHYADIPRAFRYQASADFYHAIWISHWSPTSGYRVWDPLNPDTTAYGRWYPRSAVEPFAASLGYLCGWIDLEPIDITTGSVQTAHV